MRWRRGTILAIGVVIILAAITVEELNRHRRHAAEAALAEVDRQRAKLKIAHEARFASPKLGVVKPEDRSFRGAEELTDDPIPSRHDPELQVLLLALERSRIPLRYGPLFRTLGLSPAQRERFTENVARRDEQKSDLEAALGSEGLSSEAVEKLRDQIGERYRVAQQELLGDAGLQATAEFEETMWIRDMVAATTAVAQISGAAFTPEQAERLAQLAIAEFNQKTRRNQEPEKFDWGRLDARAAEFLSEAQLKIFQSVEPDGNGRYNARLDRALAAATEAERHRQSAVPPGSER